MNEPEAVSLASKLFASQGRTAPAEVVAEYAEMLLEAQCGSCARETIVALRHSANGNRVPTVPQIWAAYRDRLSGTEHVSHIGTDEAQTRVAETEGFWRGKAPFVVIDEFPDLTKDEARYVALSAWWAGCEADVAQLRGFLEGARHWVEGVVAYFNGRPDRVIQANKIAAACRKRDTEGIDALDAGELP